MEEAAMLDKERAGAEEDTEMKEAVEKDEANIR